MSGKVAKRLRNEANAKTIGMDVSVTKKVYKALKKAYMA